MIEKRSEESVPHTFLHCPYREEHWRDDEVWGAGDSLEILCPDGCWLGMRMQDYSICRHAKNPINVITRSQIPTTACRVGRGGVGVSIRWCEASIRAGVCPEGYGR